ncbi:hypothetical protein ACFV1C_00485 [Streptomyces sp. NPDC059605]|uniref:hypothetical protein n=1 Tax=Streptomyces sp. NPDC059605 TaxID=3346882 RepID=UPI0036BE1A1B
MSDLILAAMIACLVLLPASIVTHRRATEPPKWDDENCSCVSCTARSAHRAPLPGQRKGSS